MCLRKAHLAAPPADPTTVCPLSLAIWHTTDPTAPDATETNTTSPGLSIAILSKPTHIRGRNLSDRSDSDQPDLCGDRHKSAHIARRGSGQACLARIKRSIVCSPRQSMSFGGIDIVVANVGVEQVSQKEVIAGARKRRSLELRSDVLRQMAREIIDEGS